MSRFREPALSLLICTACACDSVPAPVAEPAIARPAAWNGTRAGTNGWVECTHGDLPVVISVPHGGRLKPAEVPDRTRGETDADVRTIELACAIVEAFRERTGRAPYLVVCNLHRKKLDANRELEEAALGNVDAERAWREYHGFVVESCADIANRFGNGIYIDLHGHAHAIARIELGYLLSARDLARSDAELTSSGALEKSSLRTLFTDDGSDFASVLRGPQSLGGLLSPWFSCVPSPAAPSPGNDPYFSGGFSTRRHTAGLFGLQIEAPFSGVRDTAENRERFGRALAEGVEAFLRLHAGLEL